MVRKQPCRQFLSKVWALHPQTLSVPVGESFSRHPLLVGRLLLGPNPVAAEVNHPGYLTNIGPDPHPVKQPGEGIKYSLNKSRACVSDQAVVRIEELKLIGSPAIYLSGI